MAKIRWRHSDYIKLGRAVSDFNKKLSLVSDDGEKSYLPQSLSYNQIKDNITTRKELNQLVKSLKEFKKEGAEDVYVTEGRLYDFTMGERAVI